MELVDTLDLGSSDLYRESSSLSVRNKVFKIGRLIGRLSVKAGSVGFEPTLET